MALIGGRGIVGACFLWVAISICSTGLAGGEIPTESDLRIGEWTSFQTASPWNPTIDIRADLAIVYGVNPSLSERVSSWKNQGYRVALMTGVAWGEYQDYIEGRFDGKRHDDEGQVQRDGTRIMHGPTVPYMVPTVSYIEYLKSLLHQAIDAGVDAIFLEEPEFWARAGYSQGFKREWQAFYNEPWADPATSPEATYRAQQLKYHLYLRALDTLFADAKEYTRKVRGPDAEMPCLVPTHSLVNYTNWGIISPESLLAHSQNVDGYIAQVWTGTARTPNTYEGVTAERTFESAILEYGQMAAMTRPTGRRVYFLTDPIEDNPRYTWENYRENYHETFIAQLLHPEVASYEVVPWPRRVFQGRYPSETSQSRVRIPVDYATELMILFNALAEMHAQKPTIWYRGNDAGIGVALSDTMMFQREPRDEDPHLSNLFGMTLPWIKRGMNVRLVQLENVDRENAFEGVKILLSSFSFMKCKREVELQKMVEWVREEGGICILFDDTKDAFNAIREWWNEGETPSETSGPATRLMGMFGIDEKPGIHKSGRGYFMWVPRDPISFASREGGSQEFVDAVAEAAKRAGLSEEILRSRSAFDVGRGRYRIVAAPDESTVTRPYSLEGAFVDLFDPGLPVLENPEIDRGNEYFFVDLQSMERDAMLSVLASSLRVEGLRRDSSSGERDSRVIQLGLRGPARVRGVLRLWSKSRPQSISWKTGDSAEAFEILPVPEQDSHGTFLVNIPNVDLDSEESPLEGILTISWVENQQ